MLQLVACFLPLISLQWQKKSEFGGFEIFNVGTTDETKICPMILSGQFYFCPLGRKGPKIHENPQ